MRMVEAGTGHLANGNIRAARMMLKPAAEAGDPVAAFTYAETYDPLVLRKVVIRGGIELKADVGAALAWYQKAKNLGSPIAADRLDNLAHVSEWTDGETGRSSKAGDACSPQYEDPGLPASGTTRLPVPSKTESTLAAWNAARHTSPSARHPIQQPFYPQNKPTNDRSAAGEQTATSIGRQDRGIADYVIDSGTASSPIIGRLVATRLHDELTGEAYAVIDGTDGRAQHVRFRGTEAFARGKRRDRMEFRA
jgi:hypothetical protein